MRAQCCICADFFGSSPNVHISAAPCGHTFHEECLMSWMKTSSTCPSCRTRVQQNQIIKRLFFDTIENKEENDLVEDLLKKISELTTQLEEKEKEIHELVESRENWNSRCVEFEETAQNLLTKVFHMQNVLNLMERKLKLVGKENAAGITEMKDSRKTQIRLQALENLAILLKDTSCKSDVQEVVEQCRLDEESSIKEELTNPLTFLKREDNQTNEPKETRHSYARVVTKGGKKSPNESRRLEASNNSQGAVGGTQAGPSISGQQSQQLPHHQQMHQLPHEYNLADFQNGYLGQIQVIPPTKSPNSTRPLGRKKKTVYFTDPQMGRRLSAGFFSKRPQSTDTNDLYEKSHPVNKSKETRQNYARVVTEGGRYPDEPTNLQDPSNSQGAVGGTPAGPSIKESRSEVPEIWQSTTSKSSGSSQVDLQSLAEEVESVVRRHGTKRDIGACINKYAPAAETHDKNFIRAIVTAIVNASLVPTTSKLREDVFKSHTEVLQDCIKNKLDFELQALYAVQALMHKLEHPSGLIACIFDILYEEKVISEEAFKMWEKSADSHEAEGKGACSMQLTQFFAWLRENEDPETS